ncbi:MAG: cyclomaltodextrinase N-terminal domain-containing protein [Bacteroidales bacterium]|nr:cyclomaltodextrinase N-terminal domain-containing protein [Bacteroidales bacterium]
MKKVKLSLSFLLLLALMPAAAQKIEHIDPPSWFTGMNDGALQLMVYGQGIGSYEVKTDYPGVTVSTTGATPKTPTTSSLTWT